MELLKLRHPTICDLDQSRELEKINKKIIIWAYQEACVSVSMCFEENANK